MIGFYKLSMVTAAITFSLFILLLILPEPLFYLFDISTNESAYIISRRASFLFLGFSFLSYLFRHTQNSIERQSLIVSFVITMSGLAMLGLIELIRGAVGMGIVLAVVTEAALAIFYTSIWLSSRSLVNKIPS